MLALGALTARRLPSGVIGWGLRIGVAMIRSLEVAGARRARRRPGGRADGRGRRHGDSSFPSSGRRASRGAGRVMGWLLLPVPGVLPVVGLRRCRRNRPAWGGVVLVTWLACVRVDDTAADEVLLDDPLDHGPGDRAVPRAVRMDDHHRTEVARVEAAGADDADAMEARGPAARRARPPPGDVFVDPERATRRAARTGTNERLVAVRWDDPEARVGVLATQILGDLVTPAVHDGPVQISSAAWPRASPSRWRRRARPPRRNCGRRGGASGAGSGAARRSRTGPSGRRPAPPGCESRPPRRTCPVPRERGDTVVDVRADDRRVSPRRSDDGYGAMDIVGQPLAVSAPGKQHHPIQHRER